MDVSALIRDVRDQAALSQAELARRAGLSQRTVSAIERGRRQPSLATVTRILAAVGLQPSLTTHAILPSDAELDAAIDAMLSRPATERLVAKWFDGPALLGTLAPLDPVLEGAAGAALHGVPVPVTFLEVAIERDRVDLLAEIIRRRFAERWSEVWEQWGMESADPRGRGPLRWQTSDGEFRVRWVDERPATITVLVGDLPVRVRPMHDIETTADLTTRHALSRIRTRPPTDPADARTEPPDRGPGVL